MTDIDIDIGGPGAPEEAERPAPVAPLAGMSIIGSLHSELDEARASDSKVIRVGKLERLYARYRALGEDETKEIERKLKLRAKVTRNRDDAEQEREQAALLLATSCEQLLWLNDDGEQVPLHEALTGQGVAASGPLRYNAELIDLLELRGPLTEMGESLGELPSSVEVVTALHRWGDGHAPLLSTARLLNMWMSGVSADALEGVFEGN